MSACISRHGEYSSHVHEATGDHRFVCTRCWVLDEDAILVALDVAESALPAALAAKEAAERSAEALQGKIDRCVARIRNGQQMQPDQPDAGLEALVVGWVNYHGDCCNFKGRAERAEARVRAVAALHVPYDCTAAGQKGHKTCGEREWCYSCPEELGWPCPTVAALGGAE